MHFCGTCFTSQILKKNQAIGILIHGYKSARVSDGEAWKLVPDETQTDSQRLGYADVGSTQDQDEKHQAGSIQQ